MYPGQPQTGKQKSSAAAGFMTQTAKSAALPIDECNRMTQGQLPATCSEMLSENQIFRARTFLRKIHASHV